MSRAPRALILTAGIGLATLGGATAGAATPPTSPPAAPPAAATTLPTSIPPASTAAPVPPAGTRGGATEGSVAKPRRETWSPRRIATMTALAVIALAAAGYAYGKLRSAPPRHPDLARRPPDLDGADHVDATS